jgi:hypothetical protein
MNVLANVLVIVANVFGRIRIESKIGYYSYDDLLDGLRFSLKGYNIK